jgi:hypothetical protein
MAEPIDAEGRRLLADFSRHLNRLDPQPLDWQRFHEFVLYAYRHSPQPSEAVAHALVQDGLDWQEAEGFVLFYTHAIELLERETATTPVSRAGRATRRRPRARRKPTARKRRRL